MTKGTWHTERLTVRPVESGDAEALFRYRQDGETNRHQGFIPASLEEMTAYIANTAREIDVAGTWFQLVIIERDSDKIIGDMGIHFVDGLRDQCEFGITLSKEYHRKGLALEAVRSVFGFLFGKLEKHRIFASVDPRNHGSIVLLEKLGMRKEAHFKKSLFMNEEWVDDVVYAVLRSEFLG